MDEIKPYKDYVDDAPLSEILADFALVCEEVNLPEVRRNRRLWNELMEARAVVKGLMEVAEIAMPDTYFQTDSRTTRAREFLAGLE